MSTGSINKNGVTLPRKKLFATHMDEQLDIDAEVLFRFVGHKFDNNPMAPVLFKDVITASDRSDGHSFGFFPGEKSHAYWFHGFQFTCNRDGKIALLCLFNANVPYAKGAEQNAFKGKLPHGLHWGMTRSDVQGVCLKPKMEDKLINTETYPSGMIVMYEKSPPDARLQRIKCVLLPEDWAQSSGGGGSASQPRGLPQNLSPAEQLQKDRAEAERTRQIAESMKQQQEEQTRRQRAESLVKSLQQAIASQNGRPFQSEFDELLQLNEALAFNLLFPLVGGSCLIPIQSLLSRNTDRCCDELDKDGRNTLHEAASRNAVHVAQALHHGSKQKFKFLNLKSSSHLTPLHEAALNGHLEMVELLLGMGADDSIQNSKGHRPFDLAVKNRRLSVLKYLLDHGKFCSSVVPFKWDLKGLEREAVDEEQKKFLSEVGKLVRQRDRNLKMQLEQETSQQFAQRRKEAFDVFCKSRHIEDLPQLLRSQKLWGRALLVDFKEEEAKDVQRLHSRIVLHSVRLVQQSCTVIARSTAGLVAGMTVFGDGIPSETTVQNVTSQTELELSKACDISTDNQQIFCPTNYNILEPSVFDTVPAPLHADLFKAVAYSLCSVSSRKDIERSLKAYEQSIPTSDKSALYLLAHARLHSGQNDALTVELLSLFEQVCQNHSIDVEHWITPEEAACLQKLKNAAAPQLDSDNTPSFQSVGEEEQEEDYSVDFEKFMESQDFKALTPDQRLPMIQLQQLSGLVEIKKIACQLYEEMTFQRASSERKEESSSRALNYAFVGSPGTGKTTVARIFCQVLVQSGARTGEQFMSMSAQEAIQLGAAGFGTELKKLCGKSKDERGVPDYWRKGLQVEVLEFVPDGIKGAVPTNAKPKHEPITLVLDVDRVEKGTFTVTHATSLLTFLPVGLPVVLDAQAKIDLPKDKTYYIKHVTAFQIELASDANLTQKVVPPDCSIPFSILYEQFIHNLTVVRTGNPADVSIFQCPSVFAHSRTGIVPGTPIEFIDDVPANMPPSKAARKNTLYIVKDIIGDKQFTIAPVQPADENSPQDRMVAGPRVCGVSHSLEKLPRILVRKAVNPKWHAAKIGSYKKGDETCSVTYADGTAEDGVNMNRLRLSGMFGKPGGVLFIDEAYDLNPATNETGRAIFNSIMQAAEEHRDRVTVILAGYKSDIENRLYSYNPGMASRIRSVEFPDFSMEELGEIWTGLCDKELISTSPKVINIATRRVARGIGKHGFANARTVRNVFDLALSSAKMRIKHSRSSGKSPAYEILVEDVIGKDPSHNPEVTALFQEINMLVGQSVVKERFSQFLQVAKSNYAKELRAADGVEAVGVDDMQLNRMFLGSPGTGKTTFAGLYARLLKCLGFLSNGEFLKKDASDLVGDAQGGTQNKTRALLDSAKGKVLLIDEAYSLNESEYGRQAIDVLVGRVQGVPGEDIAVVLCGYTDRMLKMLQEANPGLSSRFDVGSAFEFSDFSDQEMLQIFSALCDKKRPPVYAPVEIKIAAVKSLAKKRCLPNFGNARTVDVLLTNAMGQMTARERKTGASERHLALSDIETSTDDRVEMLLAELSEYGGEFQQLINELGRRIILHRREGRATTVDHYVFTGNPGTGKTWAARTIANLLHEFGVVASPTFIETSASDLLGAYVGHTKRNVDKAVRDAQGGVLFIDEAYQLGKGSFGEEGITQLVGMLTRPEFMHGKTVVILAGYQGDMEDMFARNAGLKSRFKKFLHFSDWPTDRCISLISKHLSSMRPRPFVLSDASRAQLDLMFNDLRVLPNWGNGRDADTLFKMLVEHRDNRRCTETEAGIMVARDVEFSILPQDVLSARGEFFASRTAIKKSAQGSAVSSAAASAAAAPTGELQFPREFSLSINASIDPLSKRLCVRDLKLDFGRNDSQPPTADPNRDGGDAGDSGPIDAAAATATASVQIARHSGGGGEVVGAVGGSGGAASRELDSRKMQSLLDRIQSIGAIQSHERGAEQQKEREIERIKNLIRRLESMDVDEAEEELDAELEKAAVMELCAKMGRCVMDFAWSYEQGEENGKHYDFRCCGGSHTISFSELGIPAEKQPYIRDLFRH